MKLHHYLFIALIFIVGYYAGGKWPGMLSKVPLVGSALS